MGKFEDLSGKKFYRLTPKKIVGKNKHGNYIWECECDCGNITNALASHLKSGNTKSCGCLQREKSTKHGMSYTKIYYIWNEMLQRCENPNHKFFDHYGGRGIKVCERWHDFNNFYEDVSKMEHFGEKGYSLDRRDNEGDYCPENCCWATKKQQANNRRSNTKVVYNGEEMTLPESAEKCGIDYQTLRQRYYRGKRGEDLFKPVKK